jgi:hypothetical protein
MALNDGRNPKVHSLAHVANMGFDDEFQMPMVEMTAFDPLTGDGGAIKRLTTIAIGEYAVNDTTDTNQTVFYVGKEDAAGDWYILRVDKTSGLSNRYASKKNNASYTSYADAWANYGSLTYDTYSVAF